MAVSPPESPHHQHRAQGPRRLRAAVFTVSDSRTQETDVSGKLMQEKLAAAGHETIFREVIPDDPALVSSRVQETTGRDDIDLVLLNGGTGISHRDRTFEAVTTLMERQLPGFGELFRWLSFAEIGAAAMASRAVAGVAAGKLIFSLPGSPAAVRLAMERLILPEAVHLVGEVRKDAV